LTCLKVNLPSFPQLLCLSQCRTLVRQVVPSSSGERRSYTKDPVL
jgi:hypothetical protein